MKAGLPINESEISASVLGVNEPYLLDIYRNLLAEGFLSGSTIKSDYRGAEYVSDIQSLRITSQGIEYLEENTKLKKVYKYLKEAKSWIPGMN